MSKLGPYTKKVVECFKNPKNYGRMKNPDGIGKVGNPVCGDVMWLYIKVGKKGPALAKASADVKALADKSAGKEEIITDIKFETFGCVAAIATSSIITTLAKGKTLKEAMRINKEKIIDSLGGLPPVKKHCSVLAASALEAAIKDYLSKKKQ